MIIELKDMPCQQIKSIDIHIVFDVDDSRTIVTYEQYKTNATDDNDEPEHTDKHDIPDEMMNAEF